MTLRTRTPWALMIALSATSLGADEDPTGAWAVVDPGDRPFTRSVARDPDGQLALALTWPGTDRRVVLRGRATGGGLDLRAELSGPGIVDALAGEPTARTIVLTARGRRLPPDDDGAAGMRVEYATDGQGWGGETWRRGGRPGLDLIGLEPGARFDPKRQAALTIRLRVRGCDQALRVGVLLRGGTGDDRAGFYAGQVPETPGGRVVRAWTVVALPVGEHELTFDGRDGTGARRILLAGAYTLRIESELDPRVQVETELEVAPPHAELIATRWMPRDFTCPLTGKTGTDPGRDHRPLARQVSQRLSYTGLTPSAETGTISDAGVARALSGSARVTIATHGEEDGVAFYEATPAELVATAPPAEDPRRVRRLTAQVLDHQLQGEKPLRDLHAVFLWACRAGANGGEDGGQAGQSSCLECGTGLPSCLVRNGADLVVAFNQSIFSVQLDSWLARLMANLSGVTPAPAGGGARSLSWAAKEAAVYSDGLFWSAWGPAERKILARRHVAPLSECLVIFSAPGIDPDRETLHPPRYGNSTN